MARIFISYKRDDKDVVFKIKGDIEKHVGESCWIDVDGIESDAQFVNVIIKAIDEAEIFLFMYSKKHTEITDFENDWTVREINYAQTKKKRIIFLNIDNTSLSDWFVMMFGLKQQVDVRSDVAMKKLYVDLLKWLKISNTSPEIKKVINIKKWWKNKTFSFLCVLGIVFILLVSIVRFIEKQRCIEKISIAIKNYEENQYDLNKIINLKNALDEYETLRFSKKNKYYKKGSDLLKKC